MRILCDKDLVGRNASGNKTILRTFNQVSVLLFIIVMNCRHVTAKSIAYNKNSVKNQLSYKYL